MARAGPGSFLVGRSRRLRETTSSVVRSLPSLIRRPLYVPPGHYYSPLTNAGDAARALSWGDSRGVDLRVAEQLALARELVPMMSEQVDGPRYDRRNNMFGPADAAIYHALLRRMRQRRIIEIGGGYSTAVALDTADAYLADLEIRCVEPYPERLLRLLATGDETRVTIHSVAVQDLPLANYAWLESGDVLFIDSTHVVKAGSDVVWLLLHVLPRLAPGVLVHIHDIFWPFEYPASWLDQGRDWTENYLLHAFLIGNVAWEIVLLSAWLWQEHSQLLPADLVDETPGSLWLRSV
jgi:predicted O-methyltransferase YrrM